MRMRTLAVLMLLVTVASASAQTTVERIGKLRDEAILATRAGDFAKAVAALEEAAALEPTNPEHFQMIATYYWDKAYRDKQLSEAQKREYTEKALDAVDRALALESDYMEALVYKNLILRMKAQMETDPGMQQRLIADADALRERAMTLMKARSASGERAKARPTYPSSIPIPPPPPPPPPPAPGTLQPGQAPIRVGGNIKAPAKLRHVNPVYPPEAQAARVQGVVICEATIGTDGRVSDVRVLRSIPMLDQAAIEAVQQWEFEPTLLNGAPVPVIMTVTVTFSLQ